MAELSLDASIQNMAQKLKNQYIMSEDGRKEYHLPFTIFRRKLESYFTLAGTSHAVDHEYFRRGAEVAG